MASKLLKTIPQVYNNPKLILVLISLRFLFVSRGKRLYSKRTDTYTISDSPSFHRRRQRHATWRQIRGYATSPASISSIATNRHRPNSLPARRRPHVFGPPPRSWSTQAQNFFSIQTMPWNNLITPKEKKLLVLFGERES